MLHKLEISTAETFSQGHRSVRAGQLDLTAIERRMRWRPQLRTVQFEGRDLLFSVEFERAMLHKLEISTAETFSQGHRSVRAGQLDLTAIERRMRWRPARSEEHTPELQPLRHL